LNEKISDIQFGERVFIGFKIIVMLVIRTFFREIIKVDCCNCILDEYQGIFFLRRIN